MAGSSRNSFSKAKLNITGNFFLGSSRGNFTFNDSPKTHPQNLPITSDQSTSTLDDEEERIDEAVQAVPATQDAFSQTPQSNIHDYQVFRGIHPEESLMASTGRDRSDGSVTGRRRACTTKMKAGKSLSDVGSSKRKK